MSLTVETSKEATTTHVRVAGEVDVSNAAELRQALDAALADDSSVIEADLADVPYIDSTGIGVLVGTAHRAKDKGASLVVTNPQRNVARVLDLLGVGAELNVKKA